MTIAGVAVVLAALAIAGCRGAPAQPAHSPGTAPAHSPSTAPALAKLSGHRACEQLLADVTRHGGIPDIPTLRQIADRANAPRLAADARTAVRDIDHTGAAPVAFTLLRDDCAQAGVRIPAP